jgi:AraC-like DNA-binding protein/effector-binding domain-containing protein
MLQVALGIRRHLRMHQPLLKLAAQVGLSPFQLQRQFTRTMGESPARYATRLRLLLVATELLRGEKTLEAIGQLAGFASTEVLIRSFRKAHGCTPQQYRRRQRALRGDARFLRGLGMANRIAPCQHLYHLPLQPRSKPVMPMLSATLRTLSPQPALVIRSRIPRTDIAATIGQSLGRIVPYAMGAGGALAGQPFARYPEYGPGMVTIEVGMPLATPLAGQGEIEAFTLPGGSAAVAVHGGTYELLPDSYIALEQWIAQQNRKPDGAPWEVYVTDPAEHPDPANWRTEIFQPLR